MRSEEKLLTDLNNLILLVGLAVNEIVLNKSLMPAESNRRSDDSDRVSKLYVVTVLTCLEGLKAVLASGFYSRSAGTFQSCKHPQT